MNETEKLVEAYQDSIVSVVLALERNSRAEVKAAHERVDSAKAALLAHVKGLEKQAFEAQREVRLEHQVTEAWKAANGELRAENERLKDELDVAKAQLEGDTWTNNSLRLENVRLKQDAEKLEQENAALKAEAKLQRDMVAAIKHTVVATIGGMDNEGNPTSEINYLQRLRALVKLEQENAALKANLKAIVALIESHTRDGLAEFCADQNCNCVTSVACQELKAALEGKKSA